MNRPHRITVDFIVDGLTRDQALAKLQQILGIARVGKMRVEIIPEGSICDACQTSQLHSERCDNRALYEGERICSLCLRRRLSADRRNDYHSEQSGYEELIREEEADFRSMTATE